MARFLLYGRDSCPFCCHAEDYFIATGAEYYYFNMEEDLEELEYCKDFFDFTTVPIILENCFDTGTTKMIGGYTDLMEYVGKVGR